METLIRDAELTDVAEISVILQALVTLGMRSLPADEGFVRNTYDAHPDTVACSVAEDDDGSLLGLQILKRATEGNEYGVTPGWGIIGTHVNSTAFWRGIGAQLFVVTRQAAQAAGLAKIEATIGAQSPGALAYYDAMGFETFKTGDTAVHKCFDVSPL